MWLYLRWWLWCWGFVLFSVSPGKMEAWSVTTVKWSAHLITSRMCPHSLTQNTTEQVRSLFSGNLTWHIGKNRSCWGSCGWRDKDKSATDRKSNSMNKRYNKSHDYFCEFHTNRYPQFKASKTRFRKWKFFVFFKPFNKDFILPNIWSNLWF